MKTRTTIPDAPEGISEAMQTLWRDVHERFVLELDDQHLLELGLRAYDRAEECRAVLDREGMTYTSASGIIHNRPEVGTERMSRASFQSILRQLNLDGEPPRPQGRPAGYSPQLGRRV